MQAAAPPIQTVQMQVAAPLLLRRTRSRYSCSVKSLGILQIVLSGVSAVLGISSGVMFTWYTLTTVCSAAWGGVFFYLPAGILGILSVTLSVNSRRCTAIGCMVMSILSSLIAGGNIILYSIALADMYPQSSYHEKYNATLALNSLIAVTSLTELVVSIVAAVYCCYVMKEYRTTTTTVPYVPTQGNPPFFVYNQPGAFYPNSASPPPMLVANQAATAVPAQPPNYEAAPSNTHRI